MCADLRVCHRLLGVGNRLCKAPTLSFLRLGSLDPGHVGGLHQGLFAIHLAVRVYAHLAGHACNGWVKSYFDYEDLISLAGVR